jgi:hypothetical protein
VGHGAKVPVLLRASRAEIQEQTCLFYLKVVHEGAVVLPGPAGLSAANVFIRLQFKNQGCMRRIKE